MSKPAQKDTVKQYQLPENLKKLVLRAEGALELRNWGYAVSMLQAVVSKEPKFWRAERAFVLLKSRRTKTRKRIKLGAEALKVLRMKGDVKKDPVSVMNALEKDVLATDPYNEQANELLYEASMAAGLPSTAAFALETLVEGHPNEIKFLHSLGDFQLEQENFSKASEVFQKILERDRTDLTASKKFKDATARASIISQNLIVRVVFAIF